MPDSSSPSMTAAQKQAIIDLINSPLISRGEKTRALLDLPGLNSVGAEKLAGKLRQAIAERGAG